MGSDVLCQAKSGMGKTAVFVLSILQQIKVEVDETTKVAKVGALVMAHTRELAFQVSRLCLCVPSSAQPLSTELLSNETLALGQTSVCSALL